MRPDRICDTCKTGVLIVITSKRLVSLPYQKQRLKCKSCGARVTRTIPAETVWRRDF